MGSFYSSCSVSSMTLTNQKTVRILLVPSAYVARNPMEDWEQSKRFAEAMKKEFTTPPPEDKETRISYDSRDALKEKGLLVSNEGSLGIFTPFGFPIRGTYADYGNIDEIERDRNVEMLEKYFNLPIDKILDAAGDDRWYLYGIERPAEEQAKKDAGQEYDEYELNESPKMWKIGEDIQNINVLRLLTYTDINAEVYDALVKAYESKENWWDKYREEYITKYFDAVDENRKPVEGSLTALMKRFNIDHSDARSFIPSLCKHNFLKIFDIGREWEAEYRNLYYFILAMSSLHKLILPSVYGSQEDNYHLLKALNNTVNSILEKEIEEDDEDDMDSDEGWNK